MICSSLLVQLFFKLKWLEQGGIYRDIPVQKASIGALVPPGKKHKNAILAEIVREIKDVTLKQTIPMAFNNIS